MSIHLSQQTLIDHLHRHYGICGHIERIPRGRASNYLVSLGGKRWLLKVFQRDYTSAQIQRAADFVSFLARTGYPTHEFVLTVDGARTAMMNDRVAVLIPWVDGDTPEPNTVSSPRALIQIGALCGRLHRLAGEYPQAPVPDHAALSRSIADKRASLLQVAADQRHVPEIAAEVNVRVAILSSLGEVLAESRRHAARGIIHGDFSGAHVVFQGDRAVAVIDVMGDLYLPAWELMRAFFQSVPSGGSPTEVDQLWRPYIQGYRKERAIEPRKIALAYDVYLLQLTTSTYGLRQPLDNGLREFGRWRTRLALYLAEHRAELRQLLMMETA